MTLLLVEVEDFVDASASLHDDVVAPLASAANRLAEALYATRGMAGGDPAGLDWAHAYDPAARRAVAVFAGLIDGCAGLATLFEASARNYAAADVESTAGVRGTVDGLLARLPTDGAYGAAVEPPSAAGVGVVAPPGWELVASLLEYVWPGGHQDRLRAAEHAWYAASAAIDCAANEVGFQTICFTGHHLPEAPDIVTLCSATARHLRDAGHVFRVLAGACGDYAQCLDDAHRDVETDLGELAAWTIATEAASALAAAFTFGASEVAGQAVVADRIALTAADIAAALGRFVSRAADAARTLPPVESLCRDIDAVLTRLRSIEVVRPSFAGAPALPRAVAMLRVGEGGELGAAGRIARAATRTPPIELIGRSSSLPGLWADIRTLARHFRDHGGDFGCRTADEYAKKATAFLQRAYTDGLPMKIDPKTGTIRVFDPSTNTFGSYSASGATRTFFKPTSSSYWDRQPGELR